MRELTLRHERATNATVRALEKMSDEMRRGFEEMRLEIAAGRQVLLDLHETAQAQNQAILKVLDRMD
jgi:hypothetical protein